MTLKPLLTVMIVASLFAILFGILLPSSAISIHGVKAIASVVTSFVPCVSVIANSARDSARAEITWSVQWLFAPAYLIVLIWSGNPWGIAMRTSIIKTCKERANSRCNPWTVILGISCLFAFILSDFGVINFVSFFKGDIFKGDPLELPILLRVPFESNIGMALYGWFVPLGVAMFYWLFLLLIVNFKLYLKKQNH